MCNHKNDSTRQGSELHDRRDVLKLAAALVAAPLAGTVASASQSAPVRDGIGAGPVTVRGYGFASVTSRMAPLQIERRALSTPALESYPRARLTAWLRSRRSLTWWPTIVDDDDRDPVGETQTPIATGPHLV